MITTHQNRGCTTHQKSIKKHFAIYTKTNQQMSNESTPKWSINMLIKRDFNDQDVLKKGWYSI